MEKQKLDNPFGVLFETNPMPMWIFDSHTLKFLAVNEAAILHYGFSREEFLSMTLEDVRPPEDVRLFRQTVANLRSQPGPIYFGEWQHCKKDHTLLYVLVSSQPAIYEGHEARLSMLTDVTSRKNAEDALQKSELQLKEAQHVAGLGSWEWDINRETSAYSDELYRLFGLPPQGVKIDIPTLIAATHPDDRERFQRLLEDVAQKPRDFEINIRVKLPDGGIRHLHALGETTSDCSGKPIKMTGTAQDITGQIQVQEERLRNARLQAANKELEAFSYTVSHDLRTPLRSIDAFGKMLSEEYGERLDENGRSYLELILTSTQRMNQLINDLIEFSRVTGTQMERGNLDLGEMVEGITRELQRTDPERKVEWRITPGLSAHADPRLLRIALENLIGNAWKFTGKTENARIEFSAKQEGPETVYFVRDNGAGFDMEHANRLFGVFQRLHSEREFTGTGIGLAIVQRIIARHGGRIWAEGALNKGATFSFTLPDKRNGQNHQRKG